ncbi:uncharacterized protein AC631_04892 [Debaryomyces fabryi]|uniref:ACB domain-containing protein n=1 Tax=Debaryomyces fabryi TaxID=58627 RepID=A0A0V1PT69_9ASCO|nr:uncharacterized protein AC631_04892 [Debaryomyces fabryi]KRZ99346.1 hypothetical protein AC631_04892 [Debaryomyces fabryi]
MPRPMGFSLEDEGAKKKWDAWKREEGLSKTEAKRRYISYLIDTMKVYASGTLEARELLSELEYLWDQIKDLQYTPEEEYDHPQIPLPSHSPLFSQAQSDRYSTATPLPLPSNYSASVSNLQYRNNLQKIYSHSRKNTMLSINDYVLQQRQQQQAQKQTGTNPNNVAASVYSLPAAENQKMDPKSIHSLPANSQAVSLEDFKTWQGEINLVINKLSREYLHKKPSASHRGLAKYQDHSESESDLDIDAKARLKRRLVQILKLVSKNALKFAKNFSISLLALLLIVWCIKKNVIVKQTIVKQPINNLKHPKKELVINMILNTDENKWFIRLLNIINSFVGFV